jgi:uncharacterized protein YbaP (TraB family)
MSPAKDLLARRFPAWAHRCLFGLVLVACAAGAEPAAGGKLFLWEVKSATNSVYVFGSMHAAKPDMYPLPQPVEEAYRQADRLVVEADITDQAKVFESFALLTYAPPDSLDKHVSPEVWKQLEATPLAQDAATLKTLRPAALASILVVGALAAHGYDPQAGIDLHFLMSAHASAKQVVELESAEFQAGILGSLTDEEGNAMLSETLKGARSGELVREADKVASAWKAGDDESLGRLLREANKDAASKKIYTKLIDERNPAMAEKIAALASGSGHAFVVIGAGHLAGDKNVLELLKAKGLKVRQLP